jgi:thiamine transport system permease protein
MAVAAPADPPVAALIFMLCFASFATVLSLGGGPQATTIELAIYQALSYDYDPGARRCWRSCRWLLPGAGAAEPAPEQSHSRRQSSDNRLARSAGQPAQPPYRFYPDRAGAPASAAAAAGGYRRRPEPQSLSVLQQPVLWQATWTSLRIALAAGLLCVILTMMLLWSSRELYARQAQSRTSAGTDGHADSGDAGHRAGDRLLFTLNTPSACRKAPTAL